MELANRVVASEELALNPQITQIGQMIRKQSD